MTLGILLVRDEKMPFFQKWHKLLLAEEVFETQCRILVYRLAYTKEELSFMTEKKKNRLYKKAVALLKKRGCLAVAPDALCAAALGIKVKENRGVLCALSYEELKMCIIEKWNTWGKKYLEDLCIIQTCIDKKAKELLCLFAPVMHHVKIVTKTTACAEIFCEEVCSQYGVYPQICQTEPGVGEKTLYIDLDKGRAFFGHEWAVDGVEKRMDTKEYLIDQERFFASCLQEECLSFVGWTYRKKRLTKALR